jgi:ATP-dependent helicase HrpA
MTDPRIEEIRTLLPQAMLSDWVRLGSRLVRLMRDRLHPDAHDAVLERLLGQARASVALRERRRLGVPAVSYPPQLPITARKDDILAAIRDRQVVIVAGETGSGKTTQLPKMCLEAGLGIEAKIGCTQPRRVAVLSISRRIAEELNVAWGREVGCKIRFDDRCGPETCIKLMTDGILLAESQGDPLLSEYNALILDEAHERSLNIDFLLGYLKGLLAKRPGLKLIITSATIDTAAFSGAFDNAPVIEVSGRLYPVETVYAPFEGASEESGEFTYIDAALAAAEQALGQPGQGDILIFMPGERDIRETTDQLKARLEARAEIIPLFGRLSSGEQQKVFAPASRPKIVVATNIAETSLTIPGIRCVIDSGLARLSRYNPRTRTQRLPIEPISQSSANQRKGRSGRVRNGVCIRLYSEADFAARPLYTQPEIQRANLAEVILRMMAFRLGQIETFPFINPPAPAAIQGGYALLQELGALDEARQLTPLGGDLARLPIDPTLGRMLLQSQREHATRELLIIAAGLSIQDPRERPLDQKDAAAAAHQRFADPRSDFLSLLNLWNAVHDQWETLRTQSQRRKFCKANFLSYLRMREWQDLHAQLHEALEALEAVGRLRLNDSNAAYDAIHRSILAGLLGHVATRTESNVFKGAANRQLTLFPGSALYDRAKTRKQTPRTKGPHPRKLPTDQASGSQPEWIVAGEIIETSQLFARTVAGIDPRWIVELAPHLCRVTFHNPHWSPGAGRVLAEERSTLYGLEVHKRTVAYGNINPKEATQIFIRSALVEEGTPPDPIGYCPLAINCSAPVEEGTPPDPPAGRMPAPLDRGTPRDLGADPGGPPESSRKNYPFLEHNRRVRQKIETWQTRLRRHDLPDLDQALFDFYVKGLENVSSWHELNRLLRGQKDPKFLCVSEADLAGGLDLTYDALAFPDSVPLGGQSVPVSYAYSPGEEHDGVTLKLDPALAQAVSPASVEWAVPGLREAQVGELLRALPKGLRRQLMPFPPKVAEIARDLRPGAHSLLHDLSRFIHRRYGLEVPVASWPAQALPPHLRPRLEVLRHGLQPLLAGRDLLQLRRQLETAKPQPPADPPAWLRLARQWERFGLTAWNFGDLPERLAVEESGAAPLYAWLGLHVEEGQVNLRLFHSPDLARQAGIGGLQRLLELALQKDLAWLQKDLRALARIEPLFVDFSSAEALQAAAFVNLKRHIMPGAPSPVLTESGFRAALEQAKGRLPGLASQLIARLEPILKLRQEILRRLKPAPAPARPHTLTGLKQLGVQPVPARPSDPVVSDLEALLPRGFLETIPFERLPQLPRYLKALLTRAERAALNPLKDRQRAQQVAPYLQALHRLQAVPPKSQALGQCLEEFRWMIEEFKVSLFAQELGTAFPISAKRLDQQLERILGPL